VKQKSSIIELNNSPDIDGILVQLPLPMHIASSKIIALIDPKKDIDGFHPLNMGYLASNLPGLRPCTPKGIMSLLEHTGVEITGKHAVILGSSLIVGKPTALELMAKRATVTICNSKTQKIQEHIAQADILIVAIGKAEFVQGEWCKPGSIIIDVGINTKADGKLCGDVHFATAVNLAQWITPVPGGVGPMTVASLMENTVLAYKVNNGL
jgi:methylenetetrahydrofolate dehydrogenase (NADP+)/methenyltetrahydrofolate cyclohydrolase